MSKDKLSEIGQAIERAVRNDCEKNITVSFSGGIDSTLVAFLASKYTNVELIAVGVKDSHDIEAAKSAAKIVNLDLTVKELNDEELISEASSLQKKLKLTQFEVGFMLPFWVAAKNAKNKILMCGQGADEVFGGYVRHFMVPNIWSKMRLIPFEIRKLLGNLFLKKNTLKLNSLIFYNSPNFEKKLIDKISTGCSLMLSLIHISEPTRPY